MLVNVNYRSYHAHLVIALFFMEEIIRREWPAHSPDMDPKKHVWVILRKQVAGFWPLHKLSNNSKVLFYKSEAEYPCLLINKNPYFHVSMFQKSSTLLGIWITILSLKTIFIEIPLFFSLSLIRIKCIFFLLFPNAQ